MTRVLLAGLTLGLVVGSGGRAEEALRAGAAAVDVSPATLPVIVNGNFFEAKADKVNDPLFARCLVLDDGETRLALVVVDSCMMPRELLDEAKRLAREQTGIPTDRVLISATHTHSAPSVMGALGSRADAEYARVLPGKIAEAIGKAIKNLEPARAGWAVVDDAEHTHCRRWIFRPDRVGTDPFGGRTVRANMHPGHQNPNVIGPSGPSDPGLSVLAVQARDGRPIALLANYSMHYFGAAPVSADYFGLFSRIVAERIGAKGGPEFVAMMSQGTSGDQQWRDYGAPDPKLDIRTYAEAVAGKALDAYRSIRYHDRVPLAMAEATLTLRRRVPDAQRLEWARSVVAAMGDRLPRSLPEVYAKEAIFLHDEPERTLKLQALRIGELGVAAIPDEVYALTGLKIKARSPLPTTFTIELANGSEGYIPPPEQHRLGGYTTWPARTAALEVGAEPKIVEAVLKLLEQVSGRPRRAFQDVPGPYAKHLLDAKPLAYWRLGEDSGPVAVDATGNHRAGTYEGGVAFFLPGPDAPGFRADGRVSRAPYFAGGRVRVPVEWIGETYSVSLWFWNGLPHGEIVALAPDGGPSGDHLSLEGGRGRLMYVTTRGKTNRGGPKHTHFGRSEAGLNSWHHVVMVRTEGRVRVYLDGDPEPEIDGEAGRGGALVTTLLVGGSGAPSEGFEGKIAEVAVFGRALTPEEVSGQYRAGR